eukprot:SAG11_NODE_172_length_13574_cov_14.732690_10_plen_81_part_00
MPATMAGKMRNLGPISPDFVYGSSSHRFHLENQGGMEGQSQRLPQWRTKSDPLDLCEEKATEYYRLRSLPLEGYLSSPAA